MSYHPLADMLQVAVPLRVAELERAGGPSPVDWAWAEDFGRNSEFANHADELIYRGRTPGKAARMFNEVARALSIMAFLPGGIRFDGTHYRPGPQCGKYDPAPYERRR